MAAPDITESTARANFIPYLREFIASSKLSTAGKSTGDAISYYDARYPGFIASFGKMMYGVNRSKITDIAQELANAYGDAFPDPAVWNAAFFERVGTTTWGDLADIVGDATIDTARDVTKVTAFGAEKLFQAVLAGIVVWFIVQALMSSPKKNFFKRAKA